MVDNKELEYIGNLSNGEPVYNNKKESHLDEHSDVTKELLIEALQKFDMDKLKTSEGNCVQQIDMGRVIGKATCVVTTDKDQIFYVRRKNRVGETPTVLNREPADCRNLVIIIKTQNGKYTIRTAYIGNIAPREPWTPSLLEKGTPEEIEESNRFWSNHALIYDSSVVDFVVLPDERKVSKDQFEMMYMNKDRFDVPNDSLVLLVGMFVENKSKYSQKIAEKLDLELIDFDKVKEKQGVFRTKEEIYEEIERQVEENLENGKGTLVNAPFIFESGSDSRKNLYKLAQKYNKSVRVIILKTPFEVMKKKNSKMLSQVSETDLRRMWEDVNKSYGKIKRELDRLENGKMKTLEGSVREEESDHEICI